MDMIPKVSLLVESRQDLEGIYKSSAVIWTDLSWKEKVYDIQ